jgi:glycosyltransferase involved in cell wall biosynthesis
MSKIDMVVPIFNDHESLMTLLSIIDSQKSTQIHYLIVNNGSTDSRINELLENQSKHWSSINLIQNQGFGGGILEGIKVVKTDWVGWMPGNLKIKPSDVEKIVSNIELNPKTFIKCHRIRNSRSAKLKTLAAGVIQSVVTGKNLLDTGGTPTICERSFVLSLRNLPTDYVLESRMLFEARKHKLKIVRPSIPYGERVYGSSHWQRGLRSEIALMHKIWASARNWKDD